MRALWCVVVLLAAMGCGCGKVKNAVGAKPSMTAEAIPSDWTHREFVAHLNEKGVSVTPISTNYGSLYGLPVFLIFEGSGVENEKAAIERYEAKKEGVVICSLQKTTQDAKDLAGSGKRGVAIGRFVVGGTESDRNKILAAFR